MSGIIDLANALIRDFSASWLPPGITTGAVFLYTEKKSTTPTYASTPRPVSPAVSKPSTFLPAFWPKSSSAHTKSGASHLPTMASGIQRPMALPVPGHTPE